MKIAIESSSEFLYPISNPFSILTSSAEININDIQQDIEKKVIQIPLKRKEIIKRDRRGFFDFWKPTYDMGPNWINAVLTIRQVIEMKIQADDILKSECDSRFALMMGIGFGKNSIVLSSIEETRGKTLCEIKILVSSFNLELKDTSHFSAIVG